jgi:hypothetical protein
LKTPGENLIFGRGNPFQFLIALSQSDNANGNLYWDDGDSIGIFFSLSIIVSLFIHILDLIGTKTYNYFEFSVISVSHDQSLSYNFTLL